MVGARKEKQNRIPRLPKKKPFKLELGCKNTKFYPKSQLFKSKRRGF